MVAQRNDEENGGIWCGNVLWLCPSSYTFTKATQWTERAGYTAFYTWCLAALRGTTSKLQEMCSRIGCVGVRVIHIWITIKKFHFYPDEGSVSWVGRDNLNILFKRKKSKDGLMKIGRQHFSFKKRIKILINILEIIFDESVKHLVFVHVFGRKLYLPIVILLVLDIFCMFRS